MLTCLNNVMSRCGQGRAAAVTGIYFGAFDTTVSSFRAIIDGNNIDAATPVHKASQNIPLVSTQFPALATLVDANAADIAAVSVTVGQNATAVSANATDIGTNITNITSNDVDIASLMTSVTANETAIDTKQATLTFSTVASDHETNPCTAKEIKTYVDANAGGSGATLASNTFTGTQTVQPASGAAVIELKAQTGAGSILQLAANPYGGASLWVGEDILQISGDRVEVQATVGFRIPRHSSAPSGTNNASFGCLYADTSGGNSDCKLYFHNGTTWKEVTLS